MKVDYVEDSPTQRHLDIEVPKEELETAFEKGVSRLRRTVKLPGFRKGKTPKDVIRARFHSDVMNDAVKDIVQNALMEALQERELQPLGDPNVSHLESELGKPLKFRATFEVMPDVVAQDYKGFEIVKQETEVTDEQVDKGIDAVREQHARFEPIEGRGAQDGDFVVGVLTEKPVEGGEAVQHEDVSIEVGSDAYHRSLHEALQNAEAGNELSFNAAFAADHGDPERAGKTFEVQFDLRELKEKVLPEADDELAKDLGDYDTLEELRAELRKNAEARAEQEDEQHLRNQLLQKLVEANPFDAPDAIVDMEVQSRLESAARDLAQRGIDPNQAGIDWRAMGQEQRAGAEAAVKATFLLDKIAEEEELEASDEEIDAEVERVAKYLEKSPEAARAQMMKEGALERLKSRLRREKAVDFVKQHAKLK